MKRAVLCVTNPQDYLRQLSDYSVMIVNPAAPESRKKYLLDHACWSLLIEDHGETYQNGPDMGNEKLFWYTSGTTGDSKFCSFSQAQLDHLTKTIIDAYQLTANDRYAGVMPLWHAHGQGMYWATLRAGCEQKFYSMRDIRSIADLQPTFVSAVPDILKLMLRIDLNHVRFVRSASAALRDQLYTDLQQKFQVPVIEAFGMTEALSHCFTNPLAGPQRMGTVGLPDGIQARIVNGELHIQGPSVFEPGWFNTGDLAEQDEQGYFKILGRSRDRITIRGYKIDPISIERQLEQLVANIGDVVVFGSERVNCVYTGTATLDEVTDALVSIHPSCRPAVLKQMDAIPLQDNGKMSRTWLGRLLECK